MARITSLRSFLSLGLVVGLAATSIGACKKSDDKKKDESGATAPTAPAGGGDEAAPPPKDKVEAPAGGGAQAAPAGDDLSLLPVDSEIVMGLNFQQLQQSSLWKQFVEPKLLGNADFKARIAEAKDKCGIDPMAAVTRVSLGLKGLGSDKPDGVIVGHGLDKGKIAGCLDKLKTEKNLDVTQDGDVTILKHKGETIALTFVNDSTLLVGLGAVATKDGVTKAAAGTSALKTSAAFVEMYGKINARDSLWMLMNGNSAVFDNNPMGVKPKAVFGSVNVTDGLAVDMRMRLDSADQATQLAKGFEGQVAAMRAMVDKVEIGSDGADVKVVVALSSAKLQMLIAQFGGMLGGGMGGP